MANLEGNGNGVFGGVEFNQGNEIENTSYFEMKTNNVFGGVNFEGNSVNESEVQNKAYSFEQVSESKAIAKTGVWTKIRSFIFQEIDLYAPVKVELTPYQQKVEKEINDFLHQEISFKGLFNIFKNKK